MTTPPQTPIIRVRSPLLRTLAALRREWPLLANVLTAALFFLFGPGWLADLSNPLWYAFLLAWLFAVILAAAFAVVRHAEAVAARLGEPLGTLVLTLAVTGIEVMMISAVMYSGHGHPTLARDAMFAVIMVVLNGMVGLSLLVGGLRYREQTYNLQGANSFLAVIVPIAVLSLVLPNFTTSSPGPTYSPFHATFLIVLSVGLYGVFLAIQNVRHRDYFLDPSSAEAPLADHSAGPTLWHAGLLVVYLIPLVYLAEQLAVPIDYGIEALHAPPAVGGFLVSVLVLSPESMAAVRAAQANQLQRAVNVLLGSVMASISLTVPAVLSIGFFTGKEIVLGLDAAGITMLALTLGVSTLTFASARTNVLLGAVHLLLFLAYLMLLFEN
jgi:Ca2+:H+ antiporter